MDWPTVPKVFSRAVVSKVTWCCCTITGLTGPGGPDGPCPPGYLGCHPLPGGPPSSEGPPLSGGFPLLEYPLS